MKPTGNMSADIYAWDKRIGMLQVNRGRIYFQYDRENDLDFSPIVMDLEYSPIEFSKEIHQKGLPGFVSDYLPGRYGEMVMNRFYQNNFGQQPNPIDELLFLGNHALGALEFRPSSSEGYDGHEYQVSVRELFERSRDVIIGEESDFNLAALIAISNSAAGGAKAKAIVGYNPAAEKIYISHKHADIPEGFRYAMIKFDTEASQKYDFLDVKPDEISYETRLEYVYSLCAKEAGIRMPQTWLIEDDNGWHFAVERFDRNRSDLFHMHSYAGLHHNDAAPQSMSYEMLFRTGNFLNVPHDDTVEIFKIMLFNLAFANRDDHAKNFSFLMDNNGEWRLSPAYDLTFSEHQFGANWRQLTIGGSANRIYADAIQKIAQSHNIANIGETAGRVLSARKEVLPKLIKEHAIPPKVYDRIEKTSIDMCKMLEALA